MESRLTARRGENVLALIGIPAAVLLFFGSVDLVPVPAGQARIDVVLPGTLALAIIAAGLVNLGIATAYERGVRRPQAARRVAAGAHGAHRRQAGHGPRRRGARGGRPDRRGGRRIRLAPGDGSLVAGVRRVAVLLGTAAFAAARASPWPARCRAEATLTVANVLFIGCLLLGGIVVPLDHLPDTLATISGFPAAALSEAFRAALGVGRRPRPIVGDRHGVGGRARSSSRFAGSAGSRPGQVAAGGVRRRAAVGAGRRGRRGRARSALHPTSERAIGLLEDPRPAPIMQLVGSIRSPAEPAGRW